MNNCNGSNTPMNVNFKSNENSIIDKKYEFQCGSLIWSLMYATVGSRSDLTTSVYYLSKYQWITLKRILRYVKQTVNFNFIYTKDCNNFHFSPLIGYTDADWAETGKENLLVNMYLTYLVTQ